MTPSRSRRAPNSTYQRVFGCTRSCAKSATSVVRSICVDGAEEVEPARQRAVGALDQERPAVAGAVVVVDEQIEADLEQVQPGAPLGRCPTRSGSTETSSAMRCCVLKKLPSVVSGSSCIGAVPCGCTRRLIAAHLHRRSPNQRVAPQRALGDGAVMHALVDVDRRVRRRERAERRQRRDARKEAAGADQRMLRRQVGVDARERAEPVRGAALVLRAARHVVAAVAVLRRLLEEQPVLDDRSAELEVRAEAGDAVDVEQILRAACCGTSGRGC